MVLVVPLLVYHLPTPTMCNSTPNRQIYISYIVKSIITVVGCCSSKIIASINHHSLSTIHICNTYINKSRYTMPSTSSSSCNDDDTRSKNGRHSSCHDMNDQHHDDTTTTTMYRTRTCTRSSSSRIRRRSLSASSSSSSSFPKILLLSYGLVVVVLMLNVWTAWAGIEPHDVMTPMPHHRMLEQQAPTESSKIDYTGCYMDYHSVDDNHNGYLEQQEYYHFVELYTARVAGSSGGGCHNSTASTSTATSTPISMTQKSTFYTLACLCEQMEDWSLRSDNTTTSTSTTSDAACCIGTNAKLYTAFTTTDTAIPVPQLSQAQKEYFKTICFYTDASIPASVRSGSDGDASCEEENGNEDFPMNGNSTSDDETTEEDDDDGEEDEPQRPSGTAACRFSSVNLLPSEEEDDAPQLTLRHYSDPIEQSMTIQLVYNRGEGWLGLGMIPSSTSSNANATEPMMIENVAVIGLPTERTVQFYDLTGRSITGVTPSASNGPKLLRSSITQNGDQTIMTFTQSASEINENGNIYNGTFTFIYAVGRTNELAYHTYRGSGTASYYICDVLVVTSNNNESNTTETETTSTSNTTETTDTETEELEPDVSATVTMAPTNDDDESSMTPSSAPTSSSIVSIVTSASYVPSSSPTSNDNDETVSMAPSGGTATTFHTTAPTPAAKLRGTTAPTKEDVTTAKDIIETFLNGSKDNDDASDSSPTPEEVGNNDDRETTNSGMASFIKWLRAIWQFSKKPFVEEVTDDR